MKDKNTVVLNAVKSLKNGAFKATAIKVELEGQLNRGWSEKRCFDYLKKKLEIESGCYTYGVENHWPSTPWHAISPEGHPIKYLRFYNDGSVDSEMTVTLSLEKPENIFWLPKIVTAWNALSKQFQNVDTTGAGLHMALINSKTCVYPSRPHPGDATGFNNFSKSMQLLLPALYFLATPNERSRYMEYRIPRITRYVESLHRQTKYSAISYRGAAIEFRVFDTCYDNPESILDNVVVIKNCMKYWTPEYKDPGLCKITSHIEFGNERGHSVERFYNTVTHIQLLNAGLRRLKPCYYTTKEVKEQRAFKLNQAKITGAIKQVQRDAKVSYKEYSERLNWQLKRSYFSYINTYSPSTPPATRKEERAVIRKAKKVSKERVKRDLANKTPLAGYIQQRIDAWQREQRNLYVLGV